MVHKKTLWIKEAYLQQILVGRKTVEVRVGYSNIIRLRPGDQVLLNEEHLYEIKRISRYVDFLDLMEHENCVAIAPDLSSAELLENMRRIYPPEKESLGVIALEIEPV
jgi:ASC-1-like (ASCH) protein